jgi:hypothetical protein
VYTNYNLNPGFKKGFFDRIIMKYDTAATKRDTAYWSTQRPVPLEADENRNFVFKDSVAKDNRDSAYTRRSLDSLRKTQKPIGANRYFLGGVDKNFYSPGAVVSYHFAPFLPENIRYNTVEGVSVTANQSLSINPRGEHRNYTLETNTRYGFSNRHLNAYATFTIASKTAGFRNRYLKLTGGKRLLQFNRDNPVAEGINTVYTLLRKRNYLKVYEAWTGKVEYNNNFESGLRLNVTATFENRIPVENTTDYAFFKKGRTVLPNHPFELAGVSFSRHSAFVAEAMVSYQPGQQYIQFPTYKMPVGSQYPTFELRYSKGIPALFKSTANFDKWKLSVLDDVNLKLLGIFRYRIGAGGFINDRQVDIPDFTHFNGNQTFQSSEYLGSFQLAPYYRYSNTEKLYGLLHVEHHFNGFLTNKIPLLNKLKWNLVAGTNTFYINRNNYYVEAFAGLENILKVLRVDLVTAAQAQPGNRFGVRVGFGGVLGGSINRRR